MPNRAVTTYLVSERRRVPRTKKTKETEGKERTSFKGTSGGPAAISFALVPG